MPIVHASSQPQAVDKHGLVVKARDYARQTLDSARVNLDSARVELQEVFEMQKGKERDERFAKGLDALQEIVDALESEKLGRADLDSTGPPSP